MQSKVRKLTGELLGLYLFTILTIAPFYMQDKYNQLGVAKFYLYRNLTVLLLTLTVLFAVLWYLVYCYNEKTWRTKNPVSVTDWFAAAYLVVVIVSYLFSDYKENAFWGAKGWFMGLFAQTAFVLLYFCASRFLLNWKYLAALAGAATTVVYLFAVLQRFSIDPLRLHEELEPNVQLQFISTLGQATWYSSFLCVCFPAAIGIYYGAVKWEVKLLSGAYLMIAMASLVTQNSDSAFFALGLVLLVLFGLAFRDTMYMKKFLEIVLIILSSFRFVGFLQKSFPDKAVELERLSMSMTQGMWLKLLLPAVLILYMLFVFWKKADMDELKFIRNTVLILLPVFAVGTVCYIWLNSNGYLLQRYGWRNTHNYLLFDDNWGSGRGSSWKLAWRAFCELSGIHKLVGVGADCFGFYCYDNPVYEEILIRKWGSSRLTNAHNEFLNSAICYGILGIIAYTGFLLSAFWRFVMRSKNLAAEYTPYILGAALTAASYAGHNFFCYQQVLCTPYLFLMLGVGEFYCRAINNNKRKYSR